MGCYSADHSPKREDFEMILLKGASLIPFLVFTFG